MKHLFLLFILLFSIQLDVFCQENEEYYVPPSERKDVYHNSYPNLDRKAVSLYFGLEGGLKLNYFSLDNSLNNLISGQKNSEFYWGIALGYNMDNRWAVETGFYNNPSYFVQILNSGSRGVPFSYKLGTNLQTIPLRFKYKLFTLDPITKTASIYVGAGVLLGTNAKNKELTVKNFSAISASRDSIKLKSETFLQRKGAVQFELSIELQGRISNNLSVTLFGRGNFGSNGIISSDLTYSINGTKISEAKQILKGISYNFGLVAKYDIARGYKYRSKSE